MYMNILKNKGHLKGNYFFRAQSFGQSCQAVCPLLFEAVCPLLFEAVCPLLFEAVCPLLLEVVLSYRKGHSLNKILDSVTIS